MNVLEGLKLTLRNFSPFSLAVSVVLVLDSKLWTCNIRLGEETGNWPEMGAGLGLWGQSSDMCLSTQLLEYCWDLWIAVYEGEMEIWDLNKSPNMDEDFGFVFQASMHPFSSAFAFVWLIV